MGVRCVQGATAVTRHPPGDLVPFGDPRWTLSDMNPGDSVSAYHAAREAAVGRGRAWDITVVVLASPRPGCILVYVPGAGPVWSTWDDRL